MKRAILVTLICAAAILVSSQAFAFELMDPNTGLPGYIGPMEFVYDNWDVGSLYNPDTSFDNDGDGTGNTDSWGIFSVSQIQAPNSGGTMVPIWNSSLNETLEGWFYSLSDDKVDINSLGSGSISSVGGIFEMYLGTSPDLIVNAGPGATPALGSAPADIYNVTNGSLFLSANFVPGILAGVGDTTTTYFQTYTVMNPITGVVEGNGQGYLSLTGGDYYNLFNSNAYLGGTADLYLGSHITGPGANGWIAESDDPVAGYIVPEPASMLLLGFGLLGAAIRRRILG